jgi:Uroporphyrinogen decarboxylase (URO-D)
VRANEWPRLIEGSTSVEYFLLTELAVRLRGGIRRDHRDHHRFRPRRPRPRVGIFHATQFGTGNTLTDVQLVVLRVEPARRGLEKAIRSATPVIVHVRCAAPRLDAIRGLPVDVYNWHDRTARLSLAEARALAPDKLLVGGLDGSRTLPHGNPDAVRARARDTIVQAYGRGVVIAPGCVIAIDASDEHLDALCAAVDQFAEQSRTEGGSK